MEIHGRRCKPLLDDLIERYWNLEEEALDRTVWGNRFGSDSRGPVIRRSTICRLEPSLLRRDFGCMGERAVLIRADRKWQR